MTNGLISIIVPIYNVELYLEECIQSIVNQTYGKLEIILVDDGSPDECPSMCDVWKERDSRIRVIHKENGGLSDARNVGMEYVSGEYVSFVDGDDWIAPEMLERLKNALEKDRSDVAACTVEMFWEDSSERSLLTIRDNCILSNEEAQKTLLNETKLKHPVWYKLYRYSIIKDIPFKKGKYHEDVFWSYQAIGNAKRVSIIDYIGYFYRQRADSIMGNRYSLKRLDMIEAYCDRYEYVKANYEGLERQARISILANCIYHGQMAILYLSPEEKKLAFSYLNQVKNRFRVRIKDLSGMKMTHRIWLILGQISLKCTGYIKNVLNVGL